MKTALLIALLVCVWAAPALAQDRIELWADENMSTCNISEPVSPPIVLIHVFVTGPTPANGVRFKAPKPDCWVGATWLGDRLASGVVGLGTSQSDWSVVWQGAGECAVGNTLPAYLGAISYLISGQAQPCCKVDALPAGQFVFTDCGFAEHPLEPTRPVMVNPNEICGCQSSQTTAVEPTSWGRVKALYR